MFNCVKCILRIFKKKKKEEEPIRENEKKSKYEIINGEKFEEIILY